MWQALGQVLRNVFIQAILSGFDRAAASNARSGNAAQAHGR
jgi:hypothetical protein